MRRHCAANQRRDAEFVPQSNAEVKMPRAVARHARPSQAINMRARPGA